MSIYKQIYSKQDLIFEKYIKNILIY